MSEPVDPTVPPRPAPPVPPQSAYGQPPYAPPEYGQPAYGQPPYGQPAYGQAPQVPLAPGFAPPAGYAAPPQGYGPWTPQASLPPLAAAAVAPPATGTPAGLGLVAFLLALAAAVVASALAAIAGFNIGVGMGTDSVVQSEADFDWSLLSPVRDWVLMGEVAFWAGTVLGIWAIVQGIVAIARNRGRGWGIAAVVVAVLGPIVFGVALWGFLAAGVGSAIG